jgi:hypothetical protein
MGSHSQQPSGAGLARQDVVRHQRGSSLVGQPALNSRYCQLELPTTAARERLAMIKPSVVEPISYAGYRFPPEVIGCAVWLYFRFPLSLRVVEEMLGARSIDKCPSLS